MLRDNESLSSVPMDIDTRKIAASILLPVFAGPALPWCAYKEGRSPMTEFGARGCKLPI